MVSGHVPELGRARGAVSRARSRDVARDCCAHVRSAQLVSRFTVSRSPLFLAHDAQSWNQSDVRCAMQLEAVQAQFCCPEDVCLRLRFSVRLTHLYKLAPRSVQRRSFPKWQKRYERSQGPGAQMKRGNRRTHIAERVGAAGPADGDIRKFS